MKRVETHVIKPSSPYYTFLDEVAYKAKNLHNATLYELKKKYKEGELHDVKQKNGLITEFTTYDQPDYRALPAQTSQQVMISTFREMKSYDKALNVYVKYPYKKFTGKPKSPKYLHKQDGRYVVVYTGQQIKTKQNENSFKKDGFIRLPGLDDVNIHTRQSFESINQIRIVPCSGYYTIEVVYTVPDVQVKNDNGRYVGIDLGKNNFATVTSNIESPFIMNGRPLRNMLEFLDKKLANITEPDGNILDHDKECKLKNKTHFKVSDYVHKCVRYIVDYMLEHDICKCVVGYNKGWKRGLVDKMFRKMPFKMFVDRLKSKCEEIGIEFIQTKESYTSMSSFLDKDIIPDFNTGKAYGETYFSGRRIKRGLYKSKNGTIINADVNGSLNILRKALPNTVFVDDVKVSGTPAIINIAL